VLVYLGWRFGKGIAHSVELAETQGGSVAIALESYHFLVEKYEILEQMTIEPVYDSKELPMQPLEQGK